MNSNQTVFLLLAGCCAFGACDTVNVRNEAESEARAPFSSDQPFRRLGRALAVHSLSFEFNEEEKHHLVAGLRSGLKVEDLPSGKKDELQGFADGAGKRFSSLEGKRRIASESYLKELGVDMPRALKDEAFVFDRGSLVRKDNVPNVLSLSVRYWAAVADRNGDPIVDTFHVSKDQAPSCLREAWSLLGSKGSVKLACPPGGLVATSGLPPVVYPGEWILATVSVDET